ncbi:PTS mannitol transporter subunit IICB [Dorea acetigenes]|uniref:PTS mannitol transporter subunit IICB n=1 Tax=Dorea acetigenes TaxID=2981787 RepID=A0ABT2RNP7_9FIRM|nr:PTS mannitol transporter subunit IICB [Dorea acetigenes]MCU6686971.1 PTS mannitol transporter subunit IICB [Dorea acetigenes]SCJ20635.1 EIICB-Mtl [uncultured Clostridium sp.]
MEKLNKLGKFYTRIIMKHIGIFIFIGILFVVFHDQGWFPNENMYAISQLVYEVVLPALLAFEGGRKVGETGGGILAVLATAGLLTAESSVGILGAMVLGPAAGFLWRKEEPLIEKYAGAGFQMLGKNLAMGITGSVLAVFSYYLVSPVLAMATGLAGRMMNLLITYRAIGLLSVIIEPLKVFFMNNVVNLAILVPLGMEQLQETGSSVLFLLETNPGPGLGMLAALFVVKKERRNEYLSAIAAELAGGIHEVYFPFVWSDLRLLAPLILGGMAGNFTFVLLDAGLKGMVSPGSIFIILLMAGRGMVIPVLAGIFVSVAVSFGGSLLILRLKERKKTEQEDREEKGKKEEKEMEGKEEKRIGHIGFVCDGGVGSSAMGAAIFRRMLAARGMEDVCVKAYASDLIPEEIDLIVCQRDYFVMLPKKFQEREVYTVENLVSAGGYEELIEQLQRRNEGR